MATVTLAGDLVDLTGRSVDEITNVIVKAAYATPAPGGLTTTRPRAVAHSRGRVTIQAQEGVRGWLHIDGDGWSDSIPFVAAAGMTQIWEAVANALPIAKALGEFLDLKPLMQKMLDEAVANAPSSLRWYKGKLTLDQDLNTLSGYGVYESDTFSIASSLKNRPEGAGAGGTRVTVTPAGKDRLIQEWTETLPDGTTRSWQRAKSSDGTWHPWTQTPDGASVSIPQGTDIDSLTTPNFYQVDSFNVFGSLVNYPGTVESSAHLWVKSSGDKRLIQEWTTVSLNGVDTQWRRVRLNNGTWTQWENISAGADGGQLDFETVVAHGDSQVAGPENWPESMSQRRPGWKVSNWGAGGARPDEILLRDAARGVIIEPGVVLKPKAEVPVTIDWDPVVRRDGTFAVLGTIDGRSASLKYSASKSSWVIYLTGGTGDLTVDVPMRWVSSRAGEMEHARHVVWFGGNAIRNNDHLNGETPGQHVIRAYCDAIDAWGLETIICGYVPAYADGAGVQAADEIRDWAAVTVPTQFLDMRNVLQANAAEIMGRPLTDQDSKDIAAGHLPRGMYVADGVHLDTRVKSWIGKFMTRFPRGATPKLSFYSSRSAMVAPSGAL